MPEAERGALITAIHLKKGYGIDYLENLPDSELVELYDRLFAV